MKNLTTPTNARSPLDRITIASPCSADWSQMQGGDRRRFCASCNQHVYDLSRMTRAEAGTLLQQAGQGRVCVRFFRRADGTVLTRDCPVGVRQRVRRMVARATALWFAFATGLAACVRPAAATGAGASPAPPAVQPTPPPPSLLPSSPLPGEVEMGDMVAPEDLRPRAPLPVELMGRVRVEHR